MVGKVGELASFWEHHSRRPREWQFMGPQPSGLSMPYAIYGDDAGVFEKSKVLILMLHAVLCDRPTIERSFLITVLPYDWVADGVTLNDLYTQISWSLQACEFGRHPFYDSDGTALEGWRATVAGQRLAGPWNMTFGWFEGDWKFTKETFHLKAYGHNQC